MIPLKINLLKLRNKINIIDKKIVILLSKRKSLYQDIVQEKLIQKKPIRDIHRENELIKQLKNLGKKYNLNTHYIKKIFQIIIEDSVSTQQKLLQYFYEKKNNNFQKISYLGPRESYSYIAACLYTSTLSKNLIKYAENNFKNVLQQVEKNITDLAILPLENTCSGTINEVLDLLQTTNLFIIDELLVPIQHCLLANKNTNYKEINTIYSHPQPIEQCSDFINKNLHWKIKYTQSSSSAMQYISQTNLNTLAAIGNLSGRNFYNLKILKKNISNKKKNTTRFIVLSQKNCFSKTDTNLIYKILIMISLQKTLHSITNILTKFKENKLILTKIEMRPTTDKNNLWGKVLFIDLQTTSKSNPIKKTINFIQDLNQSTKILGYYTIKKNNYTE